MSLSKNGKSSDQSEIDYYEAKQRVRKEQRDWKQLPQDVVLCGCCGRPGATQTHHWLFHGRKNYPEVVLHDPHNLVWVCSDCHIPEHPELKERCYKLKTDIGYDIEGWVAELKETGLIKETPELP
jgi:hypothetical protein